MPIIDACILSYSPIISLPICNFDSTVTLLFHPAIDNIDYVVYIVYDPAYFVPERW